MRGFTIYDLRFAIADSSRWLSANGDWLSRRSTGLRPGSLLTKWTFQKFESAQSNWRLQERSSVLEFGRGLPHSKTLRETGGAA
jgi:hypothetical protein